jgi:hypothetical protein
MVLHPDILAAEKMACHPKLQRDSRAKGGGADRDRTDDLLNAIIPDLSRASHSWKKYPAFWITESQQFFRF